MSERSRRAAVAETHPMPAMPKAAPTTDGVARPASVVVDQGSDRQEILRSWLPVIVALWGIGVSLLSVRLLAEWLAIRIVRINGQTIGDPALFASLERMRRRLGVIVPVRLISSARATIPFVVGWLKPAILMPAEVLTGLSVAEIEAIFAHELAHIRRHDYLLNLLQNLVETVFFYHPAVWWISARIRQERECCCDEQAASACGNKLAYARALLALEQWCGASPRLRVAVSGGSLVERVRRLVGVDASERSRPGAVLLTIGGMLCVLVALVAVDGTRAAQQPGPNSPPERTAALADPSPETRRRAIQALGELGPEAAPAIPALIDKLSDTGTLVSREARLALAKIGAPAVPALIAALESDDTATRWWAAQALEEIGPDAQLAIPALVESLGDADHFVLNAPQALGGIGPAAIPALTAIVENVKATPLARARAASSLGAIGPRARAGVPLLIDALKDHREVVIDEKVFRVDSAAAAALEALGPEARGAVAPLIELLEDPILRQQAVEALAAIGPDAAIAVPALVAALKVGDDDFAVRVAEALGAIGPAAREASPDLVRYLLGLDGETNSARREIVRKSLGRLGADAVESVLKAYREADAAHKAVLIEALGAVGRDSKEALAALIVALDDASPGIRVAACDALFELGSEAFPAAVTLAKALKDRDSEVRQHAAMALFSIGPSASEATPALIEALTDRDAEVRRSACWALASMGPRARTAAPALENAKQDRDKRVRAAAARARESVLYDDAVDDRRAWDRAKRLFIEQ